MNHLTDTEIQDYLDGNLMSRLDEITAHLDSCADCRKKLKEFEYIYSQLKIDTTPALSSNFAASVVRAVETETSESKEYDLSRILFAACILIGVGLIIYFADLVQLVKAFTVTGFFGSVGDLVQAITNPISEFLKVDIIYIVYVILIFVIIGALDYIVRHYRQKPISYMI
jgi:hypothetical protein